MPNPETNIKNNARRAIKKQYPTAWIYKPQDFCHNGIPDWIICIDGLFIAIELKVPGKKAEPAQEYELNNILKAGGRTAVCHSTEEVMQFLAEVLAGR